MFRVKSFTATVEKLPSIQQYTEMRSGIVWSDGLRIGLMVAVLVLTAGCRSKGGLRERSDVPKSSGVAPKQPVSETQDIHCDFVSPAADVKLVNLQVETLDELPKGNGGADAVADKPERDANAVAENSEDETSDANPKTVKELAEISSAPQADESGFELADAEALAIHSHPTIARARSQVEVVRGQWIQAGLPYNPVVSYLSEEIGNSDSTGIHSLGISQRFVTAGKLGLAQQEQSQLLRQRLAESRIAQLKVLTRVRTEFARTWVVQQQAELNGRIVDATEKSLEQVELLFEAQEVSKIVLLQARVEVQNARIASHTNQTELRAQRQALAAAIGVGTLPALRVHADLQPTFDAKPWESMIAEIVAASPELDAKGTDLDRKRAALKLACSQITPDITGQFALGLDTSSDDTFVSLGVSVPLPIRNRNQGNIRAARAQIDSAAASVQETRLDLQSRLASVISRYQVSVQRHNELRDELLPDAEETLELGRKAFVGGEASFLQLLTAQKTLFDVHVRILQSLGQALEAKAEIDGLLVNSSS